MELTFVCFSKMSQEQINQIIAVVVVLMSKWVNGDMVLPPSVGVSKPSGSSSVVILQY